MRDRPFNVLFLCTQNSARSIIAEAIMNQAGGDRFKGYSAGSLPRGQVHPFAVDLLRNTGHDVSGLRSKSWQEFAEPGATPLDFVFTVCDNAANEVCPLWPGKPLTAHWGLPDPSLATGSESERRFAFADTLRMLRQRISIFMNLPLDTLDEMSLQSRLKEIGRIEVTRERA
jgi:arsenate reductase (thioredoxin)